MSLKVGDTIYRMQNQWHGNKSERRFVPDTITGETKGTWIVGTQLPERVNKRTLRVPARGSRGWGGEQYFTAQGVKDYEWKLENHSRIIDAVRFTANADTLRAIDAVLAKALPR